MMHRPIDTAEFTFDGSKRLRLAEHTTKVEDHYEGKREYRKRIGKFQRKINDLQRMMYAHDRYSLLLIFQAMDAAGKDGTIRAVMSGVNVHGMSVFAFEKPGAEELDHDFLWRAALRLPERGRIGIFNRSFYEEVLVVRVHPEILTESQKLPVEQTRRLDEFWQGRYASIRDFERHLWRSGTRTLKFFLHLGRDEQCQRFLKRIDKRKKNWKLDDRDIDERRYWDDYQEAYEEAINATATEHVPWFVVPADDKKNMRLIVAQIILDRLKSLDIKYPEVTPERREELQEYRRRLLNE